MLLAAISMLAGWFLRQTNLIVALLLGNWIWFSIILCLSQVGRFVKSYLFRRPGNMPTSGLPTIFGQWITSLVYHVVAMNIVRDGYEKVGFD